MVRVLFDGPEAAVERNLFEQLEGPYAGTARRTAVPAASDGTVTVDWTTRHPLLVAVLREDLAEETLGVTVTLDPGTEVEVEFAPWSEAGASVPVYAFPFRDAPPFTASIDADLVDRVEFAVIEGNLGRLLYLAAHEKVRLRRALREVHAYRTLAHARRDALDRAGADVGVARFDDEMVYEAGSGNVYARRRAGGAVESDADYARRLRMYRRFLLPTPGAITDLLEHLFDDLPDGVRPTVQEADDRFAVAVHLTAVGAVSHRDNFLASLRRDRLILPAAGAANDSVHHGRRLPQRRIQAIDELRGRLRQSFSFAAGHGIAPPLAQALDRAGRVCRALGFLTAWNVQRAQDASAGSRYQLGLGIDLAMPTTAQATDVRNRILNDNRTPSNDATAEALIAAIRTRGTPVDPELTWLWRGCGLQTTHRVNSGTLYLSHLPTGSLVISGPANANPGTQQQLQANFHAPGDPGTNAILLAGLTAAASDWADEGEPPWTSLSDPVARTRWDTVPVRPTSQPIHQALGAAGLPSVVDPAPVVASLKRLPDELVETIELDAGLSAGLVAGQPAAAEQLGKLVGMLRAHRVAAALPLVDGGNRVLLVVSVIGLPLAGLNLADRRATGFRWYLVPLGGAAGEIKAVGSRTTLVPRSQGLLAVVALSYVRTGLTDPYEFRVELPDEAVLTLDQYERLMNALTRVYPIGVEVNTYGIRRNHVDLDGDGTAEPLRPAVSRTYRTYQRRQRHGVHDPSPEEQSNG